MKDNEAVYDEQIFPLMKRVIAICKEHGIPMHATFQYGPTDEDGGAPLVTTHLPVEGACPTIGRLYRVTHDGWGVHPSVLAMTIRGGREGE